MDKLPLTPQVRYMDRSVCVASNVEWYCAIFRAHGTEFERNSNWWMSRERAPAFHSNFINLTDESSGTFIPSIIELHATLDRPWAIKDAYASLDLQPFGFEILFEANWVWREAAMAHPPSTAAWTKIQSVEELQKWEKA